MDVRFCPECGAPANPGDRFCRSCGATFAQQLDDLAATVAFAPSPAAPAAAAGDGDGKGISIGRMLKFGWHTLGRDPGTVIGLFIAGLASVFVVQLVLTLVFRDAAGALLSGLVGLVLGSVVSVGLIHVCLKLHDGRAVSFGDLFAGWPLVLNYLAASILFGLIVVAGLILFVVPGIMWGLRFGLYQFAVVDMGLGPIDALKESSRLTSGARWDLFGLYYISVLVVYVGALALLVGLFVTVPVAALAWAHAYRSLQRQTPAVPAQPPLSAY